MVYMRKGYSMKWNSRGDNWCDSHHLCFYHPVISFALAACDTVAVDPVPKGTGLHHDCVLLYRALHYTRAQF